MRAHGKIRLATAIALVVCMAASAAYAAESVAEPYNMGQLTIPLTLTPSGGQVAGSGLTFDAAAKEYAIAYSCTADMANVKTLYSGLVSYVGSEYADGCTLKGSFLMSMTFPAELTIAEKYKDAALLKQDAQTQLSDATLNGNLGVFMKIDSASVSGNTLTVVFSYKDGMNGRAVRLNGGLPPSVNYNTPEGMLTLPAANYADGTLDAAVSCSAGISIGITNENDYQKDLATKIKTNKASPIQAVRDIVNALFPTDPPDAISTLEIPISGTATNALKMARPETGALRITKKLSGNDTEAGRAFDFTVTFTDATLNGQFGDIELAAGKAAFTLAGGGSVTIEGLPKNVQYTVVEADYSAEGYATASTNSSGNIVGGVTTEAEFVNSKSGEPDTDDEEDETELAGGLRITKNVTGGDAGETEFVFTIVLSDRSVNGRLGDMTFKNGTATFTLRDGETKRVSGLPAGTGYAVSEEAYAGYGTSSEGALGSIPAGGTATVSFVNAVEAPEPPTTGDGSVLFIATAFMLLGAAAIALSRKSQRG